MKKIIALLGLLTTVSLAHAQTTNLMPNGDFSNTNTGWLEVNGGGAILYEYPPSGGNPDGYGVINRTNNNTWAIWVCDGGNVIPLSSLGLTAGQTYTFLQDMKVFSGTNLGGIKVESWDPTTQPATPLTDHGGDKRFSTTGHNISNWETYGVNITLHPLATGIKLVPLWGGFSSVGFDNFRVAIPLSVPLSAEITGMANGALRPPDFDITASASVSPGAVTNVDFFDGNTLLGNLTAPPYVWPVTGASLGAHALKVVAKADTGASVTSAVVNITVSTEISVTVDPTKVWSGYMNVFENPANGGGFLWGSGWTTADLRASFCGSKLTLSPNTIGDPADYWYVTTNSPSVGNKIMNANFYVEPAGSLPGQLVTFSGTVQADSLLTALNPAGQGWTVVAFIKDFTPNYSGFIEATAPMVNGAFNIQLQTSSDPANHVQYGFTVHGPCVWPTDPALASYGNVQIALSSPVAPTAPTVTSSLSGGNLNLSFPTQPCHAYTVLYKTNLSDVAWSTLTITNGTGATAIVSSPATDGSRFYRLSVQ